MKIKVISFLIVLICLFSAVSAGLFSVYRSEGRILSDEQKAWVEAFLEQHDIDPSKLPDFLTE